jgi:hypothetical protein
VPHDFREIASAVAPAQAAAPGERWQEPCSRTRNIMLATGLFRTWSFLMYIFSANATAKGERSGVPAGQRMPFLVYIDFVDLFGAEQLCKIYLINAGFTDVEIEKRKYLSDEVLADEQLLKTDTALKEALESGYMVRMFEEDNELQ